MSEWQPIDTAPKDGSWFIAYRGESKSGTWDRLAIVRWHDDFSDFIWPDQPFDIYRDDLDEKDERGMYEVTPYEARGTFTHWMPLPSPPVTGDAA